MGITQYLPFAKQSLLGIVPLIVPYRSGYRSIGATIGTIIGANIEFIGDILGDMSAIIDDNTKIIGVIFYDIIYDTKRFTMTLVLLSMTRPNLVFTNIEFSMVEG